MSTKPGKVDKLLQSQGCPRTQEVDNYSQVPILKGPTMEKNKSACLRILPIWAGWVHLAQSCFVGLVQLTPKYAQFFVHNPIEGQSCTFEVDLTRFPSIYNTHLRALIST